MKDRVRSLLPHDSDVEKTVLGGLILSPGSPVYEDLKPAHFYVPAHRTIFEALQRLEGGWAPVNLVALADALHKDEQLDLVGGSAALAEIVGEAATAEYLPAYVKILRDLAAKRNPWP